MLSRRRILQSAASGCFLSRLVSGAEPKRIAFGGIGIECSTYSRIRTRDEDFTILRGTEASQNERFAFLKNYPHPFLPTLVATAVPGGPVAADTYRRIKSEFLDRIKALLPLDGVFLPMHGAMFVEGMQDCEGDWYTALRQLVGPNCLLSASYDLHGNLSRRIIDNLNMSPPRFAPLRISIAKKPCAVVATCSSIASTPVSAPLLPGHPFRYLCPANAPAPSGNPANIFGPNFLR